MRVFRNLFETITYFEATGYFRGIKALNLLVYDYVRDVSKLLQEEVHASITACGEVDRALTFQISGEPCFCYRSLRNFVEAMSEKFGASEVTAAIHGSSEFSRQYPGIKIQLDI